MLLAVLLCACHRVDAECAPVGPHELRGTGGTCDMTAGKLAAANGCLAKVARCGPAGYTALLLAHAELPAVQSSLVTANLFRATTTPIANDLQVPVCMGPGIQ